MIRVAIVEDNDNEAELLTACLNQYQKEKKLELQTVRFKEAVEFLKDYKSNFDIVFMDIEMPKMNGMDAAHYLRKIDHQVILIFITNMTQYAVKGYEVDALDYMIKPIEYNKLIFKMDKAINIVKSNTAVELVLALTNGIVRISTKDLYYVEINGHKLTYHTANGNLNETGSLSDLEKNLKNFNFLRCNNYYLVNPKYIVSVKGFFVYMSNGDELRISQLKRKSFMNSLTNFLGQGKL